MLKYMLNTYKNITNSHMYIQIIYFVYIYIYLYMCLVVELYFLTFKDKKAY